MDEKKERSLRRRAIRWTLDGMRSSIILKRLGRSRAWLSKWKKHFDQVGWGASEQVPQPARGCASLRRANSTSGDSGAPQIGATQSRTDWSARDSNRIAANTIAAPNPWTLDHQAHVARSGLDQSGAPCTGSLFPTTERHARLCVVRDGLDVEVPHGWL